MEYTSDAFSCSQLLINSTVLATPAEDFHMLCIKVQRPEPTLQPELVA